MAAAVLKLSDKDRTALESWARSRSIRASHAERARIVLAVADGYGTSGTARLVGVSRPTVIKWRDRFSVAGLAGLDDEPRTGRPKIVDEAAIIAATLDPPPESLGVTHWSSRLLGRHLGVGDATIARAWRKFHVQPWRRQTFKFSTTPNLRRRSATWSGCTSTHRRRRSWLLTARGDLSGRRSSGGSGDGSEEFRVDDASRWRSFSVIATGLWRTGDSDLVTNEQVLSPLPAERMLIASSTNMKETVMHVVYSAVGIRPGRTEKAINNLKEDILPRVKQAPGFVKGTWYGNDQTGHSLTLFESEEQAQGMAKMVTAEPDDPIEILEVEVYELHAEA